MVSLFAVKMSANKSHYMYVYVKLCQNDLFEVLTY